MRWVCPRCRSQVSVALAECPNCQPEETTDNPLPTFPSAPPPNVPGTVTEPAGEPSALEPSPGATPSPTAQAAPPAVAPEAPRPRPAQVPSTPQPKPRPLPDGAAAIRARFRDAADHGTEPQEAPFWRGLKLGIGFMLAVAVILFLLALLMTWFFQEGWQPWLDRLWP